MNNTAAINSSNNTSSHSPHLPSKAEGIAWCSVFLLEVVFVVVGNMLTIVLFAVDNMLRKKSLFLVINMAFADLISGAVSLPIFVYTVGAGFMLWKVRVTRALLNFQFIVKTIFLQASVTSAALISAERFYAIYWPLKHRTLTMRAYRIVIFMVWVLAIVVFIFQLLISNKLAFYTLISIWLTFLLIVCCCNIAIWRKFQQRIASQQQNRAAQNQRLTKTLVFVSAVALLSWLPLTICNILVMVFQIQVPSSISYIAVVLNYLNFLLNPIVYALRIPEFRQAMAFCCVRRPISTNREGDERNKNAASLTPVAPLTTSSTDRSHLELAFEQEVLDTKL